MPAPILVLGGSGGIGGALAKRLVEAGQAVHLLARDRARLEEVATRLSGVPYSACDVTDTAALAGAIGGIASSTGLSGLAYCVGSIVLKPLKRITAADVEAAFRLNALGALVAVQAAEPALRASRGSVVLFSTVAAAAGFPNHAAIAMAKGAVEALTRSIAADLAPDVRVNCVAPSLTRTPLAASLTASEPVAKSIAALHPLGRLGEADDVAAAAAFLLAEQSGWITGQVLAVDGGRSSVRTKG
jgi:NAD(P)-dependent dehydrogenase (short-subunit alcohol dehydrogenase family)